MAKALHFERQFMGASGDVLVPKPHRAGNFLPPLCSSTDKRGDFGGSANSCFKKREDQRCANRSEGYFPEHHMNDANDDDGLDLSLDLSLGGLHCKPRGKSFNAAEDTQNGRGLNSCSSRKMEEQRFHSRTKAPYQGVLTGQAIWAQQKGANSSSKAVKREDGDSAQPTAAQVWHAIHNSPSLPEMVILPSHVGQGVPALKAAGASQIWAVAQRSASMQVTDVMKEDNEMDLQPLKRSISAGANIMTRQFVDRQSSSFLCHISGNEVNASKTVLGQQGDHHQQQTLSLQNRKDLQAQRRQEARKRRKSLLEEKQLKRAKREEIKVVAQNKGSPTNLPLSRNSSVVMMRDPSPPIREVGDLQRMDSKAWLRSGEMFAAVGITADDEKPPARMARRADEMQKPPLGIGAASKVGGARYMQMTEKAVDKEEDVAPNGKVLNAEMRQNAAGGRTQRSHANKQRLTDTTDIAPAQPVVDACESAVTDSSEDGESGKEICQTSSEQSECMLRREELSEMQEDAEDYEFLSHIKPVTTMASSPSVQLSSITATASVACVSSSFPVLPMPNTFPLPALDHSSRPLHMGFSVPHFMQVLDPSGCGEDPNSTCSQVPCSYQLPVSSCLPPYHLQVYDGSIPWMPVYQSLTASPAVHPIPGASLATSTAEVKDPDNGSSNETRGKDIESQNTSLSSVNGCSILSKPKAQAAHVVPLLKKLSSDFSNSQVVPPSVNSSHTMSTSREKQLQVEKSEDNTLTNHDVATERATGLPSSRETVTQGTVRLEHLSVGEVKRNKVVAKPSHLGHNQAKEAGVNQVKVVVGTEECSTSGDNISYETVADTEGLGQDASNLGASMAAGERFEEGGTLLDLPWVSTTGIGPNGRTINGVMYIVDKQHVKIVCTCHSKHMSPAEFVQHAGSSNLSHPERHIVVNSFPYSGQLTAAPV